MTFTGLSGAELWAALAAATALTVALYLLRPRRRRLQVPFAPLWQAALAVASASRLHRRLRHLWSLLLALAIALGLVLALGDPRRLDPTDRGHTVAVVDCSPSMGATDVSPDRLGSATEALRTRIANLPAGDEMLIARMAEAPTPLTPMTGDRRVLMAALDALDLGHHEADLDAALDFAQDMLAGRTRPQVLVFSDGQVRDAAPGSADAQRQRTQAAPVWQHTVGLRGDNLAITALSARRHLRSRGDTELSVGMHNAGASARAARLTLTAGGRPLLTEEVQLAAGQYLSRSFGPLSGADERIEAHLQALDDDELLDTDNHAFASLPARPRTRVLAVTAGNLYLQAALLLDGHLEVEVVAPEQYEGADAHDMVVFDDYVPATPPGVPAVFLHPAPPEGSDYPMRVVGELRAPHFDRLRREAPILRFTALRDVNVADALHVVPAPGDRVLAASSQGPLIVAGARAGHPFVALTFDPRDSDLPLRAAWPLLLLNIVDSFRPPEFTFQPGYRVGQRVDLRGIASEQRPAEIDLRDPAGRRLPATVVDGELRFTPRRPGFHSLQYPGRARTLSVNPPADLNPRLAPQPVLPAVPFDATNAGAHDPTGGWLVGARSDRAPWLLLVGLVFVLLCAEWWSYHRRWTT